MEKTKVVIIQDYNTPYRNGLFNAIERISWIDLHLVYVGKRTQDRQWQDPLNANFSEHFVNLRVKVKTYTVNTVKLDYLSLYKIIKEICPAVIVTQIGRTSTFLQILFWRVKYVYWNESTTLTSHSKKINWKYRLFRGRFKTFLSAGKLSDEYLGNVGFKLHSENTFRMLNSVDPSFDLSEKEVRKKFENCWPLKILFLGSYIELKGVRLLNSAIEELNKTEVDGFEFHFAGAGEISLRGDKNVINHGFTDKAGSARLYQNCHVLILPSLWDCNPLVTIEAAKSGCVLLLSDGVGNFPEFVQGNGFVFARGDVGTIVDALNLLRKMSNEDLLRMACRSLQLASEVSHENSALSFEKAIKYACNEKG